MNHPYQLVSPHSRLSQGDVLRRIDAAGAAMPDVGVVITADCDLAHNKHGKTLTMLPICSVSYVLEAVLASRFIKEVEKNVARLHVVINECWLAKHGKHSSLQVAEIRTWVVSENGDAVISELKIEGKKAQEVALLWNSVRGQLSALADKKCLDYRRKNPKGKVSKELQEILENVPSAYYLLPYLPDEDKGLCFADVRNVYAVDPDQVSLSNPHALIHASEERWLRVGRLSETVKHSMLQSFSNLFVRIGLPESYEDICGMAIADYLEGGII